MIQQAHRMFDEMKNAAIARLAGRTPEDIAEKARVPFDGTTFLLDTLGMHIRVQYPEYHMTPQLHDWHTLAVLHYLDLADGTPRTGKWMNFSQQKDGMVRGGGFDRKVELQMQTSIGKLPPDVLHQRCQALGGTQVMSNADYCCELPFLPMYPVLLQIWFADEEFAPFGRLLLDSSASHYLTVEDAVVVGELLLELLSPASAHPNIAYST